MSKGKTCAEMSLTIYNDDGEIIAVVGEDSDGLDLVEIKESGGMDYEQASALAAAIMTVANHIRERSSK